MTTATWGTGAEIPGGPSWWADINDNAAMSSEGTLLVLANGQQDSAAPFVGEGTLSVAAYPTHAVVLNGSGQLASQAYAIVAATVPLAGSGQLSSVALQRQNANANLISSGSLSATVIAQQDAATSLTGFGSLVVYAAQGFVAALNLTGSGSLSCSAYAVEPDAALMTGLGSLALTVFPIVSASAAFVGNGTLAAPAVQRFPWALNLQGLGALSSTAIQQFRDTVILSGSGALSSAAIQQFQDTVVLSGSGVLSATAVGTVLSAAFDAAGAGYFTTTSATSVSGSWSETVASGASIVVWTAITLTPTSTAYTSCTRTVTYNGTAMVSQGARYWSSTPNFGWLECFTLQGAGTGSAATFNLSVTGTSLKFGAIVANSASYANVSSFGTPVTNFGTSTSPSSGAVSSVTGQMVAQAFAVGLGSTSTPTTSAYSQTSRYSQKAVASGSFGSGITSLGTILTMGDAPGAASVTFAETISASSSWASMAIPLIP